MSCLLLLRLDTIHPVAVGSVFRVYRLIFKVLLLVGLCWAALESRTLDFEVKWIQREVWWPAHTAEEFKYKWSVIGRQDKRLSLLCVCESVRARVWEWQWWPELEQSSLGQKSWAWRSDRWSTRLNSISEYFGFIYLWVQLCTNPPCTVHLLHGESKPVHTVCFLYAFTAA